MSWTAPRTYVAGEIVTAAILNTDHRDNLREVWYEVTEATITSDSSITATTEGTAQQVLTTGSITVAAVATEIEFWSPAIYISLAAKILHLELFYDSTQIGTCQIGRGASTDTNDRGPATLRARHTPTAGSHTYTVKGYMSSAATGTVSGGAGGVGTLLPALLRVLQKGA